MEKSKKTLHSLDKYAAIGFDVDHCLIRYRLRELFPIIYQSMSKVLVEQKGYPKEMLEFTHKEKLFVMNGLVVDLKTGFIFKLGERKIILRAYYGYERISHQELEEKYGNPPTYEIFDPYKSRTDDYVCCLTFFECVVPALLAHMIEFKKKTHHLEEINPKAIMKDAIDAVVANYAHFNEKQYHPIATYGDFFPKIIENIDTVIYKQDKMKEMLHILKAKGKILFIVSNSHYEFVNLLMEHAFGKEWQKLFEFIIAKSGKPGFFTAHEKLFKELDSNSHNREGKAVKEMNQHEPVVEGNAKLLEENINKINAGKSGRILYFGDNYSTDVLAAEVIEHWDAVCIMEELGDVDFGEGYDETYWGHWKYEETPYGNIPTFWSSYMSQNVAMCTSLIDSIEMANFYEI